MKDVAYFLGSCLDENDCDSFENELLNYYFDELEKTLSDLGKPILIKELEEEWRRLYVFAWADFSRFLLGWMPTHQKLNAYSRMMVEKTLNLLA